MGTDIFAYVETRTDEGWVWRRGIFPADSSPDLVFRDRQYSVFGFLADVRNYSHSPVISPPRGMPDDLSPQLREEWGEELCTSSWLTLAELLAYDYDQVMWDRRVERVEHRANGVTYVNGAALAEEGEGRHLPLREFLGEGFFARLAVLATLGDPADVRIVFWFFS